MINLSESYKKRLKELSGIKTESFNVVNNVLEISEPYDNIQKITIDNKTVYVLFGNVDYYKNKESIKAIKRSSSEISLDHQSYKKFLQEFKKRFDSIDELRNSNIAVSIETTSPITKEMADSVQIPYIENGFKKQDPLFKMKDVDLKDRVNIKGMLKKDFELSEGNIICVIDDFITTGTTFKNAFDMLPEGTKSVGVCLFKLDSKS